MYHVIDKSFFPDSFASLHVSIIFIFRKIKYHEEMHIF